LPGFSPIASKPGSAGRDDFSNIMAPPGRINRFVYGMLPGRSQKVSRRVRRESAPIAATHARDSTQSTLID
jgi:hypothetical protein